MMQFEKIHLFKKKKIIFYTRVKTFIFNPLTQFATSSLVDRVIDRIKVFLKMDIGRKILDG